MRINLFSDTNDNKNSASILFSLPEYSSLLRCLFTLVFETAPPLSAFCATAAAPGTWCNAQISLDGPCFRFAKLKRFVELDKKKKHSQKTMYVEASIGSCCFISARHRVRNSFSFFTLGKGLTPKVSWWFPPLYVMSLLLFSCRSMLILISMLWVRIMLRRFCRWPCTIIINASTTTCRQAPGSSRWRWRNRPPSLLEVCTAERVYCMCVEHT